MPILVLVLTDLYSYNSHYFIADHQHRRNYFFCLLDLNEAIFASQIRKNDFPSAVYSRKGLTDLPLCCKNKARRLPALVLGLSKKIERSTFGTNLTDQGTDDYVFMDVKTRECMMCMLILTVVH